MTRDEMIEAIEHAQQLIPVNFPEVTSWLNAVIAELEKPDRLARVMQYIKVKTIMSCEQVSKIYGLFYSCDWVRLNNNMQQILKEVEEANAISKTETEKEATVTE